MDIGYANVQSSTSGSLSYTPSSVSNACLVVVVAAEDVNDDDPITAISFGGSALTIVGTGEDGAGGSAHSNDLVIAYLLAPGTSAGTISITGGERLGIVALTLNDVNQSSPVDVSDFDNSTSGTVHITGATTSYDDSYIVSGISLDSDTNTVYFTFPAVEIAEINPTSGTLAVGVSTLATAGAYTHRMDSQSSVFRAGFGSVAFRVAAADGGDITTIPPMLQKSDNQFASITAHRLGGILE